MSCCAQGVGSCPRRQSQGMLRASRRHIARAAAHRRTGHGFARTQGHALFPFGPASPVRGRPA
eukprot:10501366-Alexandrium_andersonii.AAC.1